MQNKSLFIFWTNLLWLAVRRFRKMWFWRVLFVFVNGGMFVWLSEVEWGVGWWLLAFLFLSVEIIVINLKAHLESRSTVVLLRSLGASRFFLVVNMLFEMLFPLLLGIFVGIILKVVADLQKWSRFSQDWGLFWLAVMVGIVGIFVVVPISTLIIISRQERYLKEI